MRGGVGDMAEGDTLFLSGLARPSFNKRGSGAGGGVGEAGKLYFLLNLKLTSNPMEKYQPTEADLKKAKEFMADDMTEEQKRITRKI